MEVVSDGSTALVCVFFALRVAITIPHLNLWTMQKL